MGNHSTEIVEKKFFVGLKDIEQKHSDFFNSCGFGLNECYIFQYSAGRNKRSTAMASMYRTDKEKNLPNEIKKDAEDFMFGLFEWVKEQKFTY